MKKTTITKTTVPVYARILAFILVGVLGFQLVFATLARVDYSAADYTEEAETMAEYIAQVDEYINEGYIGRVRDVVRSIVKPTTFKQYYLAASVAIADNDISEAVSCLDTCIDLYSGDAVGLAALHIKQGCLYSMLENWEAAAGHFRLGAEQRCDDVSSWMLLAQSGFNAKDYSGAAEACGRALECEGCDEKLTYEIMTRAYFMSGSYPEAKEAARKWNTAGGDYADSMKYLAACYEQEKDYASVLKILMEMIDHQVEDESVYQNALSFALETNDYMAQEKILKRLLEYDTDESTEVTLRSSLAAAQIKLGKFDEAEDNLLRCMEKAPDNSQTIYLYGICLMNRQDYSEAYAEFSDVIQRGELLDECLYNRAICCFGMSNSADAKNDLMIIITRNQNSKMVEQAQALFDSLAE